MLEKTLESPLDCNEIQPVHPKGDQLWIFIGRTDAEAEAPILWPPDSKSWLTGKDPDAGEVWVQEEKGMTEDEMAGWHHWLNGHKFEQTLGDDEGWHAAVHGVAMSYTRLSNWTTNDPLNSFHNLPICDNPQSRMHLSRTWRTLFLVWSHFTQPCF